MQSKTVFTIGQKFYENIEIDKYRPHIYAGASGDFNPIHIDPQAGQCAGLGGNILQGMCTYAMLASFAMRALGRSGRIVKMKARFKTPVKPGDTLSFCGEIAALEGNSLTMKVEVLNSSSVPVMQNAELEFVLDGVSET